MEKISKEIKSEIDKGTKKEVVVKVLELTEKTVNKYLKSNEAASSPDSPPKIAKISQ